MKKLLWTPAFAFLVVLASTAPAFAGTLTVTFPCGCQPVSGLSVGNAGSTPASTNQLGVGVANIEP